jgi:hypothetical protein
VLRAESLDKSALPDSGLAGDENEATLPASCIGKALVEQLEGW